MLNDDGEFTMKELTKMVEEKTLLRVENGGQATFWNKWVPNKINIFSWKALKGRLPVREEIDKRGIYVDSFCNHSLVLCDLALSV